VRIFNYIYFILSILMAQNELIIVESLNPDTILQDLTVKLDEDDRLSLLFELESFTLDGDKSTYRISDRIKLIDTLLIVHDNEIHENVLSQIFSPYRDAKIGKKFNTIGKKLVSRYFFINNEPDYQLGLINNKLGASFSFIPAFESNFSGILGMSKTENNWNLNGELNFHMENYFMNAENINFYWKRIDSLSQVIKLGFDFPHPFGRNTGIGMKYRHEIFNGLYASMENRYILDTFVPLLNSMGIGYVSGKIRVTEKGKQYGYGNIVYKAFSLISKKDDTNHRLLPTSGKRIKMMIDGGLEEKKQFINCNIMLERYFPFNKKMHLKLKLNGKGIAYWKSSVPKTRYYWFGGASSLRGYEEQKFSATQFSVTTMEIGYKPHNSLQAITFMDIGSDRLNYSDRHWLGYGIGLSQLSKDSIINIEYGLSGSSMDSGKLHVKWVSRL